MKNNYSQLKEKLSSMKNDKGVENLTDLETRFIELTKKFTVPLTTDEIDNILKEKLVDKYEEEKDSVTFATLIEKVETNYIVSMIIFDTDYTYSNILPMSFLTVDTAKPYFNELKEAIKTKNKEELSLFILEKMSNTNI